jgi:hypothetical protein
MDNFFKSDGAKYIFALTETDRQTRMKILGITEMHYHSKEKADEWKQEIESAIESCKNENYSSYTVAIDKLYELYNNMIR